MFSRGTRIVFHILHALQTEQAKKVIIRTADTDVVMIIWWHLVAFGMGQHFRFLSINAICEGLGEA